MIKIRSKQPISNLDAMHGRDAFLVATFTDIKILPFSGVIRYFFEEWKYDETGQKIPESMIEREIYLNREPLTNESVSNLFEKLPQDFSSGLFHENLKSFVKKAFINKIAMDGRYGLTIDQIEFVE